MTAALVVLAVLAIPPIPGETECINHFSLGLGNDIEVTCPTLPCTAPALITVYPWGRLVSCHGGLADPSNPDRWGNFCVSTQICGAGVFEIFRSSFESGDLSEWSDYVGLPRRRHDRRTASDHRPRAPLLRCLRQEGADAASTPEAG